MSSGLHSEIWGMYSGKGHSARAEAKPFLPNETLRVLLATIKFLGGCPCPCCLVKKVDVRKMGMKLDMKNRVTHKCLDDFRRQRSIEEARTLIFKLRVPVSGSRVKAILDKASYVPIRSAFSERLAKHGFSMFDMFLVNQLHKFELGAWKAKFTHLLRILHAAGGNTIQDLNKRYRKVPTFGRGTIRCFDGNASSMKKLAACDFKDLLQCAIPVFEKLLPDNHDQIIHDLLFDLLVWHAFAKLRMHTEDTLSLFDTATMVLGQTTAFPPSRENSNIDEPSELLKPHRRPPRERSSPTAHYHMSKYPKASYDMTSWLSDLEGDPAIKDFIPRLKNHLFARLRGLEYSGDEDEFSDEDRSQIILANNQLFKHTILRINYTTYDLRREQDSMNARTHADIMMLSHEDDEDRHPYWYARIIKVFHVNVWNYGPDITFNAGWSAKRLHRIGFFKCNDPDSFGFVDPDQVIRGVHLIPGFHYGRTDTRLGPSFVRPPEDKDTDWLYFYVNHFVDHDMFMRFRGGGVRHKMSEDLYELLRSDGAIVSESAEEDFNLEQEDDEEIDAEEIDDEEMGSEDEGSEEMGSENEGSEDEEDVIVVDEDEELDDDYLAQEGYGAL
ncbi:hypothetical protein P692DRAFT_20878210 [Suillus brevipes Sb2]|nr:hypothetical protein P692DRAFT_20878210 [Suillus brevipes Sb2]